MKRLLSFVFVLVLCMSSIFLFDNEANKASAFTAHTADEAVAYLHSLVGEKVGTGQCVALVVDYYQYLGVPRSYGNGEDYATNQLPVGWTRIKGAKPQKGDIMIWTGTQYGHVAICGGEGVYFHQNWDGLYVSIKSQSYTNGYNIISTGERANYWGVIRPDFQENPHTTHSYTEYVYYEAAHPHYKCYKCFCGEVQRNTSEPVYLESCSECTTNHTEHYYNEYLYYESTHPHYKCYRCGCGEITKNTSQPVFLDSCSECMNFAKISTGTYYIRNNATGTYMDLTNMVDADNTNIGLWTFNGSKAQQYTISYTGNETDFAIQPHCSSTRVVQGCGDTISSGSNVCLWTNNYQSRQRWKFKKTSNGYIIHNTQNLNCVMEGQADNVYLNTYNASASQTWTILNSITYNANGGTSAPDMQMKEYGISAPISIIKPIRDGYKFLGWSTSATAETPSYYAGGSYTTNANITLYAVWAKAVNNRGNVTGDDEIDSKDLTAIRRKLADWEVENFVEEAADTNGDGEFDSKDATYLARYLADWTGYTLE